MPFMRSHEARSGTDLPMSELWEESTLLCPQSKLLGGQSLTVPLIYATACKSCITSCQLAGFLILCFPCQRRLFLTLGPSFVVAPCFFLTILRLRVNGFK